MNRKAVRNSRSEKNEDFFQRKQLFNTKLLRNIKLKTGDVFKFETHDLRWLSPAKEIADFPYLDKRNLTIVYEGEKAHEMADRIAEFFRFWTHHQQQPAYRPEVSVSGNGMIRISEKGPYGISLDQGVIRICAPKAKLLDLTNEFLACLDKKYPFYSPFGSQKPTNEWDYGATGEQKKLIKEAGVVGKTQSTGEAAAEFLQWLREKNINPQSGF